MEQKASNAPSLCTWKPNGISPHVHRNVQNDRKKFLPNILEAIGQTPLIKLNVIPRLYGLKCEIYAKCEFLNPGGSVKDRIAYRMIQEAEEKGLLTTGSTIIEPTSGNTGIGLAMAAAVRGYRCIIVMPQKMSNEKLFTLQALGAEIIRTPTEAAWDSDEGHIKTSERLQKEIPNSIILNQYINPGNPLAHYDQTAEEIVQQMNGEFDYFVGGAGTGGTISGIGRRLRELIPKCKIIAIDPVGSILAEPQEINETHKTFYDVEGVGYDFIPTVLDRNVIDEWIKCDDLESFNMARLLIKKEGLLCGGSSGSAVVSAIKLGKKLDENQRIVVLLPDGIRNYMTKFVSDHWMISRGYMDPKVPSGCESWWNIPVSNLELIRPDELKNGTTCKDAIERLKNNKNNLDIMLVVNDNGNKVRGYINLKSIRSGLINGEVKLSDPADKTLIREFIQLSSDVNLGVIAKLLEKEPFVFIFDYRKDDEFIGIATQEYLMKFIDNLMNQI
ncbi:hypothetical protein PV327_010757 [Microctonus hyperodae]|uniref:Cystathionine beta-synthase n=1 Tax=Microctonus hyperodae TaxID=165561 RepID=A0AA39C8Q6_MICHY|nr:hypothetical protein PV327_010757 [Microctonus hyperodae]